MRGGRGRDKGIGDAGAEACVQRDSGSTKTRIRIGENGGSAAARSVRPRPIPVLHLQTFRVTRRSGTHRPSSALPASTPSHLALRGYP